MNVRFLFVALLSCSLLLSACTSLKEKGDELYQQGLYQEAARMYEEALQSDPHDVEARVGLAAARNKIIDRGLIEVRMLRLASNQKTAAEKLEVLLRNQLKWQLSLQGAVAATQAEETKYAKVWVKQTLERHAESAYPDQYRLARLSFANIVANGQLDNALQKPAQAVEKKGRAKCEQLIPWVSGQRFFLKEFVDKYCQSWMHRGSGAVDAQDNSRFNQLDLYPSIQYYGDRELQGISETQLNLMKQRFANNLWFSPYGSRPLVAGVTGMMRYIHRIRNSVRTASYTVEEIQKDKQGNEKKSSVKKKHRYRVQEHHETIKFSVGLSAKNFAPPIVVKHFKDEDNRTESHNERFEPADLVPQKPDLIDKDGWVVAQFGEVEKALSQQLADRWRSAYCRMSQSALAEQAESVLRCAALDRKQPAVNNWAKQNFGIDYAELMQVLGQ